MALREIVLVGDKILREQARPVERFDPELRELVRDMIETMQDADGVGLAGPQVAESRRIAVIHVPRSVLEEREETENLDSPWVDRPFAIINPEVLDLSHEREEGLEGCLSIPGYLGEIVRPEGVVVQARNEWGKSIQIEASGFLARVIQHEIDHLNGILFIDRLESEDKLYRIEDLEEDEEQPEGAEQEGVPAVG